MAQFMLGMMHTRKDSHRDQILAYVRFALAAIVGIEVAAAARAQAADKLSPEQLAEAQQQARRMSPEAKYLGRVASAMEKMLRDLGPHWPDQVREIDRRMLQADLLWGHADGPEDPWTFVLRIIEENETLWENSNLPDLMRQGWSPESAETPLDLLESLLT